MVHMRWTLWASQPAALQDEMDEAVAMLTEAAAQGHRGAQFQLGSLTFRGYGVAMDEDRAILLYTQAAVQGHTAAQECLGLTYRIMSGGSEGLNVSGGNGWWSRSRWAGRGLRQLLSVCPTRALLTFSHPPPPSPTPSCRKSGR